MRTSLTREGAGGGGGWGSLAVALHAAALHVVLLLDWNSWGLPGMELLVPCYLCKKFLCSLVHMLTRAQSRRCLLITMKDRHVVAQCMDK